MLIYTVVGIYSDNESFVDHIKAKTPDGAADKARRARGAQVLCVFEGKSHDLYTRREQAYGYTLPAPKAGPNKEKP